MSDRDIDVSAAVSFVLHVDTTTSQAPHKFVGQGALVPVVIEGSACFHVLDCAFNRCFQSVGELVWRPREENV